MTENEQTVFRALEIAVKAQTRIEAHEKVCARRWGWVVKQNFFMVGILLSVLGTLLYERLF